MKALLLKEYKEFELTDVPDPEIGDEDVLIRVAACGICGSDVHGFDGGSGRRIPPIVMGHEAAGTVERVGAAVTACQPGDRVTFDSTVYCGSCDFCARGQVNLCDNRMVLGVSCGDYRRHGCFAEFVAVPQRIVCRLPDALSFEHAAMIEAVSIAVHAVNRARVGEGDRVLIVGCGMIGLLTIQAARAAGATTIYATDVDESRLELAGKIGADETLNPKSGSIPDAILERTGGKGVDVALEAVGATPTVRDAVLSVRKGGTVCLIGNIAPDVEIPLQAVVTRELDLLGTCASSGEYPQCVELMATGKIDVEPLISAAAPLAEGPAWFDRLYAGEAGLMKVILQPMSPLLLLLIGMAIVMGSILVFRLHAFLALILAAMVVGALTPKDALKQYHIGTQAIRITEAPPSSMEGMTGLKLKPYRKQKVSIGLQFLLEEQSDQLVKKGEGNLLLTDGGDYLFQPLNSDPMPAAGDRIIHHTAWTAALTSAKKNFGERTAIGFGNTCLGIGILIAMAAIVGKCLMDSGAAERIVLSLQRAFGEKRTPLAFVGSGFTLGIPVFFDTVFYLMIPLGKAMRVRTGRNYLLYVLTIVCGGTMAHSLVPPTPGPLFVADELGVPIGVMMIGGLLVGLFTVSSGYLFALWANKRYEIPLRPSAELSEKELEAMANRDEKDLPGFFWSILPILLPVLLMGGGTAIAMQLKGVADPSPFLAGLKNVLGVLGNKNIALTIAAVLGIILLMRTRFSTRDQLAAAIQGALSSGGIIILITAAGGAFGAVLRETGIATTIQHMVPETQTGLLPLAFILCAIIRTAQGSATVAMITTVGIIAPIVASSDLSYHPLYVALAIGCGSKPISWMNDSGFWVISRMSGLTEAEMLKTNTVMGCIMATVGLVVCMLGASLIPLV